MSALGRATVGRALIAAGALVAPAGAIAFDWNETHVFNPRWPPHAKFHNAQTIALAVVLAAGTVRELRPAPRGSSVRAAALGSAYWVAQIAASAFPGTALRDPDQPAPARIGVVPVDQRLVSVACLALLALGARLAGWPPA